MFRAGRIRNAFTHRSIFAMALLVMLAVVSCSRNDSLGPRISEGMKVRISLAKRPDLAPVLGPVDSLRFDVRGPAGDLLAPPVVIGLAPDQTTFTVSLPAPPGTGRSLTVMGLGARPVSGDGDPVSMRGILYLGRTEGITIEPGNIATVPLTLQSFVPEFLATEERTADYTIHWGAIPNANRYMLTGVDAGGGRAYSRVTGMSYVATGRPMRYQVSALDDLSGLSSAPSDWLHVTALTHPVLCVTPDALDFGTSQTSASFTITNCGDGGTVTWTATDDMPWLSLDTTGGSVPVPPSQQIVTATIDRASLTPGTHTGTISIASNGGNATVSVLVQVLPVPQLCVDATTLDFPAGVTQQTFHVTNCGTGGTLTWSVADDQPFVAVAPSSGTTTTESDLVTVTIDRASLTPGTHTGTITVSSDGGTASVGVTVQVAAQPQLCAAPDTLDFGTTATSLTFNVTNCGTGGTLTWTVNDDQPWITETPVSGTTATETDPITVTVNRAGLTTPGTYTGTVTVSAGPAGNATVTVSLTVPAAPALCVSPPSLDFGSDLSSLTLNLTNCGNTANVSWRAQADFPWLGVAPASGGTGTGTSPVTVTVDRANLGPNTYTGHVTIDSDAGQKVINVSMTVLPAPALCLSRTAIDFGLTGTTDSFTITNCGNGGTLTWSISADTTWLAPVPTNGSTTAEADLITVNATRSFALTPGVHHARLTVTPSAGAPQVVDVTLEVPKPLLCLSTAALDLGLTATQGTFNITNCGNGGTLQWNVTTPPNQAWLTASPPSGTTTTEADPVTVHVDRSGFLPGSTHSGRVTVTGGGVTDTVHVTLVMPSPGLCVNPPSIDFGSDSITQTFTITNCGNGGTLTWSVTAGDDQTTTHWLSASPTSGSTVVGSPATITVTANRSAMTPGAHTGTITVGSSEGPWLINVTAQQPALCLDPPSLNFGTTATQLSLLITNCGAGTLTWSITADRPWITVIKPSSGTTTTETDGVTIGINRSLLPASDDGSLTITWNNGRVGTVPVSASVPVFPPAAPTNLVATQQTANPAEIVLTWNDNADNETGYEVQRGYMDQFGQFILQNVIATGLAVNTNTYADFIGCNSYVYRVRVYNGAGSAYSNISNYVSLLCAK